MRIAIRLAHTPDDHAIVDALWRQSITERVDPEQLASIAFPRAGDFPTARFLLAFDPAGDCVAMAGAVLPGPGARFGFEARVSLPHPALPTADRTQLGEGLTLFVAPDHRRGGLARALTFLSMLLPWDAGARTLVAENGAVSLGMARAAGLTDTGVVTMHRKDVPYHLMVGDVAEVLRRAWPTSEPALAGLELAPALQAAIERFVATPGYTAAVIAEPQPVRHPGVFRHPVVMRWGDCDPAGIVYFPRFFERFHDAMERWFEASLGVPYDALITVRKLGLPSVHTEADFRAPCRFGEALVVELRVPRLGRSSIELGYRVVAEGEAEPRLRGRTVCALMDLDPARATHARAVPWPDDLRARIESFGVGADGAGGPGPA